MFATRVVSLLLLSVAIVQSAVPQSATVTVKLPEQSLKPPPISLQRALAIAEKFVAEQKIPIGNYWLREVRLLQPVPDHKLSDGEIWSGWRWFFFWDNLGTGKGDYVNIEVDMKGAPTRRPTM